MSNLLYSVSLRFLLILGSLICLFFSGGKTLIFPLKLRETNSARQFQQDSFCILEASVSTCVDTGQTANSEGPDQTALQ